MSTGHFLLDMMGQKVVLGNNFFVSFVRLKKQWPRWRNFWNVHKVPYLTYSNSSSQYQHFFSTVHSSSWARTPSCAQCLKITKNYLSTYLYCKQNKSTLCAFLKSLKVSFARFDRENGQNARKRDFIGSFQTVCLRQRRRWWFFVLNDDHPKNEGNARNSQLLQSTTKSVHSAQFA